MDRPATTITRRELIGGAGALVAAELLGGCAGRAPRATAPVYRPATERSFPFLEVRGGPREIGRAVGRRFAGEIKGGLAARGAWFKKLKDFADAQPQSLFDTFVAAAQKHAPSVLAELRGWSEGSGVPFRDLMILNLKAEYGALRDAAGGSWKKQRDAVPGCSTIALAAGGKLLVAHNEDGDAAYAERMFMLRVHPDDGPSFTCLSYPGILPGNAPWVNDAGVAMTTNFIYTKAMRKGVGRYFLDRLSIRSRGCDEALAVCKHPERAYAFHHVIASAKERRILSLEVTPTAHAQREVAGVFLHTNHLIHDPVARAPQDESYVGSSSSSRMKVLSAWKRTVAAPEKLDGRALVAALASHEQRPFSPCRHPQGDVRGFTVATALIDVAGRKLRLYKGQPCLGRTTDYVWPGS